jgi:hypothetical protein
MGRGRDRLLFDWSTPVREDEDMATRRLGPMGWLFVVAIILAAAPLISTHRRGEPRIALWGDSMAWEARDTFARTVRQQSRASVLVHTFGGTAACDWLDDMGTQAGKWRPTVAVLAFSGNTTSACMRGRDALAAYRKDVTKAVRMLTGTGAKVLLVEAPPRQDQTVDPAGMTALDHLWHDIASDRRHTEVIPAGKVVTDHGRFATTLPCQHGEFCDLAGNVAVRSPDGVHFCPVAEPPMTPCPVPSPGAERYGTAMALAAVKET